jgi:hypothetical protein
VFFGYEPREEVRKFLVETLRLWATLAQGNNRNAIHHFTAQYLSFGQILQVLLWRYELDPNPRLIEHDTLFVDLMLHLYVNTNPAAIAPQERSRVVKFVDSASGALTKQLQAERILDPARARELKLLVNEFLVGGQMLSEEDAELPDAVLSGGTLMGATSPRAPKTGPIFHHNPADLVHLMKNPDNPPLLDLGVAMLRLAHFLLQYRHYNSPQELLELQLALLHALSVAPAGKDRGPLTVEIKMLIISMLESILEMRLDQRLSDFVEFSRDLQDAVAACKQGGERNQLGALICMWNGEQLSFFSLEGRALRC